MIKLDGNESVRDWISYRKWQFKVSLYLLIGGVVFVTVGLYMVFTPLLRG